MEEGRERERDGQGVGGRFQKLCGLKYQNAPHSRYINTGQLVVLFYFLAPKKCELYSRLSPKLEAIIFPLVLSAPFFLDNFLLIICTSLSNISHE